MTAGIKVKPCMETHHQHKARLTGRLRRAKKEGFWNIRPISGDIALRRWL